MSPSLERLRNIGPASARMLRDCGIEAPGDVRRLGAAMTYRIVAHRYPGTSVLLLYALRGAIDDRHWNDYSADEKAAMRVSASGDLTVD